MAGSSLVLQAWQRFFDLWGSLPAGRLDSTPATLESRPSTVDNRVLSLIMESATLSPTEVGGACGAPGVVTAAAAAAVAGGVVVVVVAVGSRA